MEPYLLTIRHSDLRGWMLSRRPDQKPSFLFGLNKDTHEKVCLGIYHALKADRDSIMREHDTMRRHDQGLLTDLQAIGLERDDLNSLVEKHGHVSERSEIMYQNITGIIVNHILGQSPLESHSPYSRTKLQSSMLFSRATQTCPVSASERWTKNLLQLTVVSRNRRNQRIAMKSLPLPRNDYPHLPRFNSGHIPSHAK